MQPADAPDFITTQGDVIIHRDFTVDLIAQPYYSLNIILQSIHTSELVPIHVLDFRADRGLLSTAFFFYNSLSKNRIIEPSEI